MKELKNCEPKNNNDILISILFDNCIITYNSDTYRDKETIEEINNFEVSI